MQQEKPASHYLVLVINYGKYAFGFYSSFFHVFYMPAMHTVFPEETREETGYFLCLGLVTEPCQACTEQSGDLGLTLQIHSGCGEQGAGSAGRSGGGGGAGAIPLQACKQQ